MTDAHKQLAAAQQAARDKADATLAASYLGSLARGKPKRITPEDSKRRSLRLAEARKKRWIKPTITEQNTKPIV